MFASGNQPPSIGSVTACSYSNQPHALLVTDWFAVCVQWMTSGGFVLPGHDATELHFPSAWPPFAFFRMIITHLLPSATCGRAADGPGNWNTGKQVLQRGKERQRKVRRVILRQASGKGVFHEWVAHHPWELQTGQLGKKGLQSKDNILTGWKELGSSVWCCQPDYSFWKTMKNLSLLSQDFIHNKQTKSYCLLFLSCRTISFIQFVDLPVRTVVIICIPLQTHNIRYI